MNEKENVQETREFQISEYLKCKNDLFYYIQKYVMLNAAGADVHIKLYDPQIEFLKCVLNKHHVITLKSRQTGISTMAQLYISWICTFYDNVTCGVVSRCGPEATDFVRKVLAILDGLPAWMAPIFTKRAEQQFIVNNGCSLYASQVNPSAPENLFRGKSLHVLVVDECAFINKISDAYTGCMPSVSRAQTTAIANNVPYATLVISTPNRTTGTGKFYFQQWTAANSGDPKEIYHPFKLHWTDIKEYRDDPDWYPRQCKIINNIPWKIAQELDMEFVASSNSFFQPDVIKNLNKIDNPPAYIAEINGHQLWQWKLPIPNRFYLIGVDTASSYGSDCSTIQVMDYETNEQVAEFKAKLRVDEFCPIVEKVCTIYSNSVVIPECNSYGNSVCEYLTKSGRNINIYKTKSQPKDIGNNTIKQRYGIYTNPVNRPLIIDSLYTFISEQPDLIKSKRTALELISLVDQGGGKITAEEGEHDDLSMAFAFCCYVKLRDPPKDISSSAFSKELMRDAQTVASWNNDTPSGLNCVSPLLDQFYKSEQDSEDNGDVHSDGFMKATDYTKMNGVMKKFIDTNIEKLTSSRDGYDGGNNVDILEIVRGSTNTKWIK